MGISRIVLVDVESVQNEKTGDREKSVRQARVLACHVDIVGVVTAQVGQSQGFCLTHSVEVPKYIYRNEKFIYFNENLHEVKMLTKAKSPANILLNVQSLQDETIKKAVEEWMRENL